MRAVYNPGDCVQYNNHCYKIKGRNHSLEGIGYDLVGYPEPVNQADLIPCDEDDCRETDDADTIDVDSEILDESKAEYIQRIGRVNRIIKLDINPLPSIIIKK